jgi:hypothetical protein
MSDVTRPATLFLLSILDTNPKEVGFEGMAWIS